MKPSDQIETDQDVEDVISGLHQKAADLVLLAGSYGLVLTIQTRARNPLAMGNYDIVVDMRPGHAMYRDAK